ncbi:MAG: 16S rRNA (cytidine(1402)-2'-O)-methyltransferase [Oscillospiraceae bacterium]|nr:16S rRNA (cytidine(1402)-2'-O)-methyltransferase [Oscillospiraceae bacterium]
MSGKLYVVGTPIGNLSDMTPRAVETLSKVDFIAAEDTRVTLKLLNHFEIKKPLVSYYEHNRAEKGEQIAQRIMSGENCAIVTDAGMPCISDPGEDLVALLRKEGLPIEVVPGPTAAMSAIAISGISCSRFCFEGFLSTSKKSRFEHLEELKDETRTMIFYEAPHKLRATLSDFKKYFGGERRISLCRELTKIHEEVLLLTLDSAISYYEENDPRGEYVLVLEGAEKKVEEYSLCDCLELMLEMVRSGKSKNDAARLMAKQSGFRKNELYKILVDHEEDDR